MTITPAINMVTGQMTLFRSSTLSVGIFHFCISRNGVRPLHYDLVCKIHIYMPKMTFSSLLTKISFFYIEFAKF